MFNNGGQIPAYGNEKTKEQMDLENLKIPVFNIIPSSQADTHVENGSCKCGPQTIKTSSKILIVHNSLKSDQSK